MYGCKGRRLVLSLTAGGLTVLAGCSACHNFVDPCYPERYALAARQQVRDATAPQKANGRILDQTVWNYHFEEGTDKLNAGGMDHLAYLARRRPAPDRTVYVQVAQDVRLDPANAEKSSEQRARLDSKRAQAVQKYLAALTAGRDLTFEVVTHDPPETGIAAVPASTALQKMQAGSQGGLPTTAGAGASGTTGGAGTR